MSPSSACKNDRPRSNTAVTARESSWASPQRNRREDGSGCPDATVVPMDWSTEFSRVGLGSTTSKATVTRCGLLHTVTEKPARHQNTEHRWNECCPGESGCQCGGARSVLRRRVTSTAPTGTSRRLPPPPTSPSARAARRRAFRRSAGRSQTAPAIERGSNDCDVRSPARK